MRDGSNKQEVWYREVRGREKETRATHKSNRGEIAESGLIVPGRDNKACNHLSLLHRPGNYLPIPDRQNRKGQDPSTFTLYSSGVLGENSSADAN